MGIGVDETRVRKKSPSLFYVWQHQPRSSEGGRPQTALPRRRLRPPHPALRVTQITAHDLAGANGSPPPEASEVQLPPRNCALHDTPGQTVGFIEVLLVSVSRVIIVVILLYYCSLF